MNTFENAVSVPGHEEYKVTKNGVIFSKSGQPLSFHLTKKGYRRVRIYENGRKHWLMVHRAVAMAYIPNPNKYNCINHKDENKTNNCVDNLEWCTLAYNLGYGTKPMKTGISNRINKGHKVIYNDGVNETVFPSINYASQQTGICRSVITRQCKNGGAWRYADDGERGGA